MYLRIIASVAIIVSLVKFHFQDGNSDRLIGIGFRQIFQNQSVSVLFKINGFARCEKRDLFRSVAVTAVYHRTRGRPDIIPNVNRFSVCGGSTVADVIGAAVCISDKLSLFTVSRFPVLRKPCADLLQGLDCFRRNGAVCLRADVEKQIASHRRAFSKHTNDFVRGIRIGLYLFR